jgi:hypothetical protein
VQLLWFGWISQLLFLFLADQLNGFDPPWT